MWRAVLLLIGLAAPVAAETVVAARTVRAQAILTAADLTLAPDRHPGAFEDIADAVGQETRVVLYAGRPVGPNDVGAPAIIERNQVVTILYDQSGLTIATGARALGRAGIGDRLRVMNLGSRNIVTGTVRSDGTVGVGGPPLPPG